MRTTNVKAMIAGLIVTNIVVGMVLLTAVSAATLQGDINGDGAVDVIDLSMLLTQYGSVGTADVNGSGTVDITDLSILLSNFGKKEMPSPEPVPCDKTLAAGGNIQTFVTSLASGQTGCLRQGTYTNKFDINVAGITLRSYPGEKATLDYAGQMRIYANNVTLSNFKIIGRADSISGLTIRAYGNNMTFQDNDITNNHQGGSCILVGGSSEHTQFLTVRRNKIHGCGAVGSNLDHGIYASNFSDMLVEDNLFYDIGAYAVQLYPNGTRGVVRHNVIDGGGSSIRGGIVIDGSTAVNHTIERNIIAFAATQGIIQRTGSGHQANNNCFYQNSGGNVTGSAISQAGNITANPGFLGRATGDYRLSPNSPCLAVVQYDTVATKHK